MNSTIKTTPRDVFMHLLAMVALYVSAGSFIRLLFEYINAYFPDPLHYYSEPGSGMRWAIATLIIVFPVYVWVSRFLNRDIAAHPEKADILIRKWLVYLTLFVAALLIIGDLVALIFNFLDGELTARFLFKVLSILAVAVTVFWYYRYDLKRGPKEFSSRVKLFVYAVSGVVAIAIIAGFFVAGTPFKQRLVRFDSQKVQHLSDIQLRIVNYWQDKDRLPASLDDLRDSITGFVPPNDPQSGEPYGYRATGPLSFDLCAVFNLTSREAMIGRSSAERLAVPEPAGIIGETWDHGAGEHCFSREIDPERHGFPEKFPRTF
jgi:hypothetical protein